MKYIIGNWKAHHDLASTREFLAQWQELLRDSGPLSSQALVAIAPPSVLYPVFLAKTKELNLPLLPALQDISSFPAGAHTGDLTLDNFATITPSLVIVGHSERRRDHHETDAAIAAKVSLLLAAHIVPVLCLDEPYLDSQKKALDPAFSSQLIIAYEPLSAIGTGHNLAPDQVLPTIQKIAHAFPGSKILYGGSVTPTNVSAYLDICDGVLVGSASLDATTFYQLAQKVS